MTEHATDTDRWATLQGGLKSLLVGAGLCADGADPFRQSGTGGSLFFRRLSGGGNNAVFRVDLKDQTFLLKQYFSDPLDDRDALRIRGRFSEVLHPDTGFALCLSSWLVPRSKGWRYSNSLTVPPVSLSAVSEPLVEGGCRLLPPVVGCAV